MPFRLFSNLKSLLTVGSWVTSKLHLNVYLAELSDWKSCNVETWEGEKKNCFLINSLK